MSDSLTDLVSAIERSIVWMKLALDVTAVGRVTDGSLELNLDLWRGRSLDSNWIVTAAAPREMNISLGRHEWITAEADHPLLIDHTDEQGQLYLKVPVADPGNALSAPWLAHREVVGDWRSLTRYLTRWLTQSTSCDAASASWRVGR